jgi:hypothetical protein
MQTFKRTRRERFFASYAWLILRNLIGWVLIVASFVAGPLVPGPGGIPLFLIGFALISFPGKRRLTARVLRGRTVNVPAGPFAIVCIGVALVVPVLALWLVGSHPKWFARLRDRAYDNGPLAVAALFLTMCAVAWLAARLTPHVLNVLVRLIARGRRKFRPWLRRHRIHLLPPRWRPRHPHEPGHGPLRMKEEILKLRKRKHLHHR